MRYRHDYHHAPQARHMTGRGSPAPVYLDNAATSFPKPPAVLRAVGECLNDYCGNPGRGSHRLALRAAEEVFACRVAAAELFGLDDPGRVIFTVNTTGALNLAIKGLLRPGDRAVCSDMEHNAVYRPLYRLAGDGIIRFDTFQTFSTVPRRTDAMLLSAIEHALTPDTRLLVCAHASNICPATLPLAAIGRLCHQHGVLFVVDAAQSAGVLDIDMAQMQIDALAVPGHKGLYSPPGVGMLLLGKHIHPDTLFEGGNGLDSLSGGMGDDLPERYEPGTLPLPAIAGLRAGIDFVRDVTPTAIREHETALGVFLRDALSELPGVQVAVPHLSGGTVLFRVAGTSSEEVAAALDAAHPGICVRPGFHCAALAHRTLGTPEGGAVRVSFGYFNTRADAERLVRVVQKLAP